MVGAGPEVELARLLAGTEGRREENVARIQSLAGLADDERLMARLQRVRLPLLVADRLEELAPGPRSASFRGRIDGFRAASEERGRIFQAAAALVRHTLEDAGIPALEVKGAQLARRLYGDAAFRYSTDLDVLIPAARLYESAWRCGTLGYLVPADQQGLPRLHLVLNHHAAAMPPLELHWRIHWYERRFAEDMLQRSRLEHGERVAEPIDELAALLLFVARDGFASLRLAADAGAWWDRFGADLGPAALDAHCRHYPELEPAWRAAALACQRTVGLPGAWLLGESRRRPRRREQLAISLANWELAGDSDRISADVKLVDGLLSPPGQWRAFVRRQVVPDDDSLREYYDLAGDERWRLRAWRVLHPPKMLARWAASLAWVLVRR